MMRMKPERRSTDLAGSVEAGGDNGDVQEVLPYNRDIVSQDLTPFGVGGPILDATSMETTVIALDYREILSLRDIKEKEGNQGMNVICILKEKREISASLFWKLPIYDRLFFDKCTILIMLLAYLGEGRNYIHSREGGSRVISSPYTASPSVFLCEFLPCTSCLSE